MPKQEKIEAVRQLKEKLDRSTAAVLADFRGLSVADVTTFRADLRQQGLEFHVVKNTLLGFAARDAGIDGLEAHLAGPTAILLGYDDVVKPAQVVAAFSREHKELQAKAGILQGRVISDAEVAALAALPGREELLAQTVSGMSAPLYNMASLLQAPLRNLAQGLQALLQKNEEAA